MNTNGNKSNRKVTTEPAALETPDEFLIDAARRLRRRD
jgi:hypothetical protein